MPEETSRKGGLPKGRLHSLGVLSTVTLARLSSALLTRSLKITVITAKQSKIRMKD
ncbi:hypothetical protein KIN20_009843 [Parelaphostrongylus tenuis]|uniref:Uncharacterized protein n=1 Tax=Parelaphostrongylus tenuis TaxID=148309 RepID=A0AAD5MYA0_PARTN|nr:hypothetical protein KIN20_009843 [Parelaphostrongylus tenuis]